MEPSLGITCFPRMLPRHLLVPAATVLALACGKESADPSGTFDLTCTVSSDDLVFGGVGRDAIPALSFPEFVPVGDADFLDDDERVLGVVLNGVARAYPLSIIWWHEVVNDFIGEEPVLVTYCPLTGSGIAFEPRVDNDFRNFGVSGILFENNLMMFDRTSETLWSQMRLTGICGPERGEGLPRIPVVETTWGYWRRLHGTTTVINTDTGFNLPYGLYPYGNYAQLDNPTTLFPSSAWSPERPPKELVLGVQRGDETIAYPFGELEALGDAVTLNETIGDQPLLVTYRAFDFTAIAFDRVVDGQELTFTVVDSILPTYQDAETGSTWNRNGEAIEGQLAGAQLGQFVDAYAAYWFAWSVFHPSTQLFTDES